MRINYPIIYIIAILLSTNIYAQKLDSLILKKSTPKIENPNIKKLDSLHKKFNIALNELYDKGYTVSTSEYEAPVFYHVQNYGKQKLLNDYLYEQLEETTDSFKAYFKIEVEWNGNINYIKLVGYTGNINNVDFTCLWKNIKANPATEFNIPVKTVVSIPISKN